MKDVFCSDPNHKKTNPSTQSQLGFIAASTLILLGILVGSLAVISARVSQSNPINLPGKAVAVKCDGWADAGSVHCDTSQCQQFTCGSNGQWSGPQGTGVCASHPSCGSSGGGTQPQPTSPPQQTNVCGSGSAAGCEGVSFGGVNRDSSTLCCYQSFPGTSDMRCGRNTCSSGVLIQPTSPPTDPCGGRSTGSYWCEGNVSKYCVVAGGGVPTSDTTCSFTQSCVPNASRCINHTPLADPCGGRGTGTYWCEGNVSKYCVASGGSASTQECSSGSTCVSNSSRCVSPTPIQSCTSNGAKKCENNRYYSCVDGQWNEIGPCPTNTPIPPTRYSCDANCNCTQNTNGSCTANLTTCRQECLDSKPTPTRTPTPRPLVTSLPTPSRMATSTPTKTPTPRITLYPTPSRGQTPISTKTPTSLPRYTCDANCNCTPTTNTFGTCRSNLATCRQECLDAKVTPLPTRTPTVNPNIPRTLPPVTPLPTPTTPLYAPLNAQCNENYQCESNWCNNGSCTQMNKCHTGGLFAQLWASQPCGNCPYGFETRSDGTYCHTTPQSTPFPIARVSPLPTSSRSPSAASTVPGQQTTAPIQCSQGIPQPNVTACRELNGRVTSSRFGGSVCCLVPQPSIFEPSPIASTSTTLRACSAFERARCYFDKSLCSQCVLPATSTPIPTLKPVNTPYPTNTPDADGCTWYSRIRCSNGTMCQNNRCIIPSPTPEPTPTPIPTQTPETILNQINPVDGGTVITSTINPEVTGVVVYVNCSSGNPNGNQPIYAGSSRTVNEMCYHLNVVRQGSTCTPERIDSVGAIIICKSSINNLSVDQKTELLNHELTHLTQDSEIFESYAEETNCSIDDPHPGTTGNACTLIGLAELGAQLNSHVEAQEGVNVRWAEDYTFVLKDDSGRIVNATANTQEALDHIVEHCPGSTREQVYTALNGNSDAFNTLENECTVPLYELVADRQRTPGSSGPLVVLNLEEPEPYGAPVTVLAITGSVCEPDKCSNWIFGLRRCNSTGTGYNYADFSCITGNTPSYSLVSNQNTSVSLCKNGSAEGCVGIGIRQQVTYQNTCFQCNDSDGDMVCGRTLHSYGSCQTLNDTIVVDANQCNVAMRSYCNLRQQDCINNTCRDRSTTTSVALFNTINYCGVDFQVAYTPTFVPQLVDCDGIQLRADGCEKLRHFKANAGFDPNYISVVSGYRSYDQQLTYYNQNLGNCSMITAPPGASDHQSGCAVDLKLWSRGELIMFDERSDLGVKAKASGLTHPINNDVPHWLVCTP